MTKRWESLFTQVQEVLLEKWDPIYVIANDGFRDEYNAYVPYLMEMLERGTTAQELATHLDHIRVEIMGLWPRPEEAMETARELLRLSYIPQDG